MKLFVYCLCLCILVYLKTYSLKNLKYLNELQEYNNINEIPKSIVGVCSEHRSVL